MRGKPTMNDVAIEAVVSLGTVSKVLRGDTTVAGELRERVLSACRSLNYQRNWIAASLRNRQTDTIGIIIPDILNTFYATLVEKLENLAVSRWLHRRDRDNGGRATTGAAAHQCGQG